MSKTILTSEITKKIIECLMPSIALLLEMHERKFLHVVVYDSTGSLLFDGPTAGSITDYPKRYDELARQKAVLSLRTHTNSGEVIYGASHLMSEGDVVFPGAIYYRGLVVAASGGPAALDEAVSMMIAIQLSAHCQIYVKDLQSSALNGGSYFVPNNK